MKPAPFAYRSPRALEEALHGLGEGGIALAGGQSLIPLMNFRLARPGLLVDLGRVEGLAGLRRVGDRLHIGAMTRQAELECCELAAEGWPLLRQAVRHVGHAATRSRGTVGGSATHADPRAELPVALVALDARFLLCSAARGERVLAAGDFFRGANATGLEADELLVGIEVPAPAPGTRSCFVEFARTHATFPVAGVAALLAPGERCAIAVGGAGDRPVRAPAAERALLAGAAAAEVAELAGSGMEAERTVGGPPADFRRALVTALVAAALERLGP